MKNIISLVSLFFVLQISAQKKENYKFSADLKMVLYSGIGNQYFKNSFSASPGIDFKFHYRINQKFGLFFDVRNIFINVKNPEIFGDFSSLELMNYNFGGSYTYPLQPKLDLEGNLSIGALSFTGKSTGNSSKYNQSGFTYGLGANFVYHIQKNGKIDLVGGLEYQNLNSSVTIDNRYYENYYNHSSVIIPNLGLRLNF